MTNLRTVVELVRLEESMAGTFGVLRVDKQLFCATLEPRDQENAQNLSSIPVQQYWCLRVSSPRYGPVWEVKDVPGRSHILFHAGNRVRDTEGCILLGEKWGKLAGDRAILNSGSTFRSFMNLTEGLVGLHLTVKEAY